MVGAAYLPDRVVITCIQTINKNNTRSKFHSEQTYESLQGVINGSGGKQAQKNFNRQSNGLKGYKHNNQLNLCSILF